MTNKFKVGDKVRLIKRNGQTDAGGILGNTYEITDTNNGGWHTITITNSNSKLFVDADQILLVEFTKNDLQTGDVVTLHNGDKLYLNDCMNFTDIAEANFNWLEDTDDLTDNLLYKNDDKDYDIIKVERPTYTTVFERDEEVKEMTIAEISKALGYEVKIVKEEER